MPITVGLRSVGPLLAAAAVLSGCSGPRRPPTPILLDVANRADATPWVAASGAFIAVAWGARQDGKTDVFVSTSRDAGANFSPPVQVNQVAGEARLGAELPPRVVLVTSPGGGTPEVVVQWTARGEGTGIKVARSRDGGRTFDTPVVLQTSGAEGDRGWPALAADQQGGVHAIWLDHRGTASARAVGHSHAGQRSNPEYDGVAMAQKSGLYYASLSAGQASPERALTPGVCYCCKTALATGSDGTIYAAWRHVYPGNLRDIAFTLSRDGGRSFAPPLRVSEDGWAINGCPDDGPSLALASDGEVHLAWPTVIGGQSPEGAIFYATTRDGRAFTPRVRIPTAGGVKPSHPQIVIDRSGRTFVAWDESISGQRTAAFRQVLRGSDGSVSFGAVVPIAPRAGASSPVLAAAEGGLVAVWTRPGDPSTVIFQSFPI